MRAGFCHTCIAVHPCRTARRKPSGTTGPAPRPVAPVFAGDMQFSSEEDVYNPARFAPVVRAWIDASRRAAEGA